MAKTPRPTSSESETITRLLAGDCDARDALWLRVQEDLRQLAGAIMAHEKPGTLQPTALVNEAFLRLNTSKSIEGHDRRYFFAAASRAMRRILIERARRLRHHREHGMEQLPDPAITDSADQLLTLEPSLDRLADRFPDEHEVLMLRIFGGRTIEETAELTGQSMSTCKRRWSFAHAWLKNDVEQHNDLNT